MRGKAFGVSHVFTGRLPLLAYFGSEGGGSPFGPGVPEGESRGIARLLGVSGQLRPG